MQLQYNTGTNKAYNGNIMYQTWQTPGYISHNYAYTYDKLNRLKSGVSDSLHKENNIAYDLMGNITQLSRARAGTLIDSLAYTYTGNQLTGITDATTSDIGLKHGTWSYTYDGNGNLITDPSKGTGGISIAYNLLNLPQAITGGKTITYTYDAAGNKLRRASTVTGNTDYIAGIQYDGTSTPALSFIQTEEGKAVPNGSNYTYTYYLGDNLGNTRITFDIESGTAKIIQRDDYFPFGMEISNLAPGIKNEYLYNKKELQEELGEYDYGARFYDPVIARWNIVDPLAEKDRRWSPYTYGFDDGIRFEDPDGMWPGQSELKTAWQATKNGMKTAFHQTVSSLKFAGKMTLNSFKETAKAMGYNSSKFSHGVTTTTVNSKSEQVSQSTFGTTKVTTAHSTVTGRDGNFTTTNTTLEAGKRPLVDHNLKLGLATVGLSKEGVSVGINGEGFGNTIKISKDGFSVTSNVSSTVNEQTHQNMSIEVANKPNQNTAIAVGAAVVVPEFEFTEGFMTFGKAALSH